MGTVIAAREAMEHGLAVNLSGGYHHASPDHGHGFSTYADVGLAVHTLRQSGRLGEKDKVVYVDLDAHQGNGVCRTFADDSRVFIYDQYNEDIFPMDVRAQRRIDCAVPIPFGCGEADYLAALRGRLPVFLNSVTRGGDVRLAIYNAGTDVYAGDRLGGMNVSAAGVLERDRFVLQELMQRRIPTAVVLSGGYSAESYRLVADMAAYVLETWGRCVARR
jgi:histone deacetylase 11